MNGERRGSGDLIQIGDVKDVTGVAIGAGARAEVHIQQRMSHEERRELERQLHLLNAVERIWIEGVLEKSLQDTAFIPLRVEARPEAIGYPLRGRVYVEGEAQRQLPPGTTITDVFDKAGGSLLLLGEPGAGKTTTMLMLLRVLLERARKKLLDPTNGIGALPVVVSLSRWDGRALDTWLAEEVEQLYGVGQGTGKRWVEHGEVLPLLDGLDEVDEVRRDACAKAINQYWQQHGATGLVVCCRTADYGALREKVEGLGTAVALQPLTAAMVDQYLTSGGEALAAARTAVRADAALAELAQSPLLLSMMALAFRGLAREDLKSGTTEERRKQLFARFVQRMVRQRLEGARFEAEQLVRGLQFLARREVPGAVFYVEDLGPEELPRSAQQVYHAAIILLLGLVGLLAGLLVGLIGGLLYGLVGVVAGLVGGLAGGLVYGLVALYAGKLTVVERVRLHWSWKRFCRGVFYGLIVGQTIGLFLWLLEGLTYWLYTGLVYGLIGGLVGGLVLGATEVSQREDVMSRLSPNQAIWASFRRGLLGGPVVGLVFGAVMGLVTRTVDGLLVGLYVGLPLGFIFGGGGVFLHHWVVRLVLWHGGWLPWDVVKFLDEAAQRTLLLKVGGGYRFYHGLVQEYIANLDPTEFFNNRAEKNPA